VGDWVQFNVALVRESGPALASARRVFGALGPLLDDFRTDGGLQRFHFMRKPPDVRLRLEGPAPHDDLVPAIEVLLRGLAADGAVADFFTSVYEPETRLFGGPRAMSLVHDYFEVDSRAWMDHDRLQAAGAARLTVDDLTTAVLNELFALTLDDRGEVWDTWCNVRTVIGGEIGALTPDPITAQFPAGLAKVASIAERAILDRYGSANRHLATGLRDLWGSGQLDCGLRGMLPFVGIFHYHRYGLDAHRQVAQAVAMAGAWDPRQGMKGAD
jgi:thiopeptide-type bacteriocin biosynthesis protein